MDQVHARYNALIAAAPDSIVAIDLAGIIIDFNPAAERLFGYDAAEVIGRNVSVLMPNPHREHHDQYIHRYLQTGESQIIGMGREVQALRKDGRHVTIDLSVCEIRTETDHFFTGIIRDITVRKAVDARLAECEQALVNTQLELMRKCTAYEVEVSELRRAAGTVDRSLPVADGVLPQLLLADMRILVTDDDRDARWLIRRCLETAGAQIEAASSGAEAIQAVSTAISKRQPYSAVVLDLHLPHMDGHCVATELRRLGYQGGIVIITADIQRAHDLSIGDGPVDLWLTKPIVRAQLVHALRELIPSRTQMSQAQATAPVAHETRTPAGL